MKYDFWSARPASPGQMFRKSVHLTVFTEISNMRVTLYQSAKHTLLYKPIEYRFKLVRAVFKPGTAVDIYWK